MDMIEDHVSIRTRKAVSCRQVKDVRLHDERHSGDACVIDDAHFFLQFHRSIYSPRFDGTAFGEIDRADVCGLISGLSS